MTVKCHYLCKGRWSCLKELVCGESFGSDLNKKTGVTITRNVGRKEDFLSALRCTGNSVMNLLKRLLKDLQNQGGVQSPDAQTIPDELDYITVLQRGGSWL